MKKRIILFIVCLCAVIFGALSLFACDLGGDSGSNGGTTNSGNSGNKDEDKTGGNDGSKDDGKDDGKGDGNNGKGKCSHEKLLQVKDEEASTCTVAGYSLDVLVCCGILDDGKNSICGKVFEGDEAVKADKFSGIVSGYTEYDFEMFEKICQNPDNFSRYKKELPLLEHTPVIDEAVASTCISKGKTEGSHCGVCGTVLKEQQESDYSDHEYAHEIRFEGVSDAVKVCRNCHLQEGKNIRYYFTLNDDGQSYTLSQMYGSDLDSNLVVPAFIDKLPVTALGERIFRYTKITRVELPGTITSIGDKAFEGCSSLTGIELSEGLLYIGNNAFAFCNFKNVTVPSSVTQMGRFVFTGCPFESITMPAFNDNIANIIGIGSTDGFGGYYATGIPDTLEKIIIIGGEQISSKLFFECWTVKEITLSEGIKSIEKNAFVDCTALVSVSLPDSLQYLEAGTFDKCINLQYNVIEENTYLGNGNNPCVALIEVGDKTITEFSLSKDIKVVCDGAFEGCENIETLTVESYHPNYYVGGNCLIHIESKTVILGLNSSVIPSDGSVTAISSSAFSGCTGLKEIVIPDSIVSIGKWAFENCSSLERIEVGANNQYYSSSQGVLYNKEKTAIVCVPPAISGTITIPDSVTDIYASNFSECPLLEGIEVSENNPNYATQSGILYNKKKTKIIYVPMALGGEVVIPDSITDIPGNTFRDRVNITEITIPNGVTIGYNAFSGCKIEIATCPMSAVSHIKSISLKRIVITDGTELGGWVFYGYDLLAEVTLPDGLLSIGESAFANCESLKSITLPASLKTIGGSAFYGCGLEEIYFEGTASEWCQIEDVWNATYFTHNLYIGGKVLSGKVEISNGVTSIERGAFYGCDEITSIVLSDSVQSIGNQAFAGCSALASITMGNGVKVIGEDAFKACKEIEAVYIKNASVWCGIEFSDNPLMHGAKLYYVNGMSFGGIVFFENTVTAINYGAFFGCDEITEVHIPENVKYIGDFAFHSCSQMLYLYFDSGVEYIGQYAFYGCNKLTGLEIPDSVKTIGYGALSGLSSLESITVPFVGYKIELDEEEYRETFAYIFGGDEFEGGVEVVQWSSRGSNTSRNKYYVPASLKNVTVLGGYLPYSSFDNCSMIEELTIGEKVTGIESHSIRSMSGIKTIYWNASDCVFKEGIDYNWNPCIKISADLVLGEGLKKIPERAFAGWKELEEVTLPDGIIGMGPWAFDGCTSLQYNEYENGLYLGSESNPYMFLMNVTDKEITSLTVHDGTRDIMYVALSGCYNLQYTQYDNALYLGSPSNPYKVLVNTVNYDISSCTINERTDVIACNAFSGCMNLTRISIPDSVIIIGAGVFADCYNFESIHIGTGVKYIGSGAFAGWFTVKSVNYAGTRAQWANVILGEMWSNGSPIRAINCSDGQYIIEN